MELLLGQKYRFHKGAIEMSMQSTQGQWERDRHRANEKAIDIGSMGKG